MSRSHDDVTVLKLGSSVLTGEEALPRAVHAVYAELRRGRRVVVVVSALGGTTDELLDRARRDLPRPDEGHVARLLATGEARAAALLTLALERAGVPTGLLEASGVLCEGALLDADPVAWDGRDLRALLGERAVVVVPGFVGRHLDGAPALLGRGGSDLTALFLAGRLGAGRCVLVKDVDGLYEWDLADDRRSRPGRYARLTFEDALELAEDGAIVQAKAVAHARTAGVAFEVTDEAGLTGARERAVGTLVGAACSQLEAPRASTEDARGSKPLRVGLLGLGTVGGGVARHLARLSDRFELVAVLVRDPARHRGSLPTEVLLTADPERFHGADPELVVEAIGGPGVARDLVTRCLREGRAVVTANKALLARHGDELGALAVGHGASLRGAAAVGGGVPLLEVLDRIAPVSGDFSLRAVLNGTSGFVLDELVAGRDLDAAVAAAQEAGFAEADPTLDLDGTDAAQKLQLLVRQLAPDRSFPEPEVRGVLDLDPDLVVGARRTGRPLRLVARWERSGSEAGPLLVVGPELLDPGCPLASLEGAACGLVLARPGHADLVLRGEGAGRWPTAEAVVGDLLELEGQLAARQEVLR